MKNPLSQLPKTIGATLAGTLLFFITSSAQTIYISTIEELQMIGSSADFPLSGTYELTQDIDASATHNWTDSDGEGFRPIGSYRQTFIGVFDGKDETWITAASSKGSGRHHHSMQRQPVLSLPEGISRIHHDQHRCGKRKCGGSPCSDGQSRKICIHRCVQNFRHSDWRR
ncbi:MAG: hypothetical protein ACOCW1_03770 [Chitinispirillaceae bacterium]